MRGLKFLLGRCDGNRSQKRRSGVFLYEADLGISGHFIFGSELFSGLKWKPVVQLLNQKAIVAQAAGKPRHLRDTAVKFLLGYKPAWSFLLHNKINLKT